MKIVILEGARGTGKSTITRALRDSMTNTVAVNFCGNNANTLEGRDATYKHYDNFLSFLANENFDDTPFNYLFDRTFFSELVYSNLYKDYDFARHYDILLKRLNTLASSSRNEVIVIHLTTGKDELERNLMRADKADLFGEKKFADDVYKSIDQDAEYRKVFGYAKHGAPNIKFREADLRGLSLEEAIAFVKTLI